MTKLFVDVNGTITTYRGVQGGDDVFKEDLEEFFNWATRKFDCYWLSNLIPRGMMFGFKRETLSRLPQAAQLVKPAYFADLKTEAISDGDFFWLDDNLLQVEKVYLEEHGWLDGYVFVDRNAVSMAPVMAEIKRRMHKRYKNTEGMDKGVGPA